MSNNFWDDQNDNDFRDGMDETDSGYIAPSPQHPARPRPQQQVQAPVQTEIEEYMEDYEIPQIESDEDDYSVVLNDARLRLEQGRLYELIMNTDLFAGDDASSVAAKSVQRQIRKFAKEQMEIMLGMRKETSKVESLQIDFPFNQVEVEVLKMIAKTASKGRSENSDNFVPKVTRTTEEVPVVSPKKTGLNPIGLSSKKPAPVLEKQAVAQAPRPAAPQAKLPQKAAQPIVRRPPTQVEARILAETGVTKEELDATMDGAGLTKDPTQMSADELIAHNSKASQRRQKTVKNPQSIPMPTEAQESMHHQMRVAETSTSMNAVNTILTIMNSQAKK